MKNIILSHVVSFENQRSAVDSRYTRVDNYKEYGFFNKGPGWILADPESDPADTFISDADVASRIDFTTKFIVDDVLYTKGYIKFELSNGSVKIKYFDSNVNLDSYLRDITRKLNTEILVI